MKFSGEGRNKPRSRNILSGWNRIVWTETEKNRNRKEEKCGIWEGWRDGGLGGMGGMGGMEG